MKPGISILILTRNEEHDLAACLASVAWSDDVHVFDSCSTDRTQEIAREAGAHCHERPFDNFAAQRNAALKRIRFRHAWVFILDADERLNPQLHAEMLAAIAAAPEDLHAFRVRRKDHFMGRWLRHAQIMPWYTRLVRHQQVRYVRAVNEVLEVDGSIEELESSFDHHPFSKGLTRWIEKHNLYSTMEAGIVAEGSFREDCSWNTALFGEDFHRRRRAQKAIFYCLPCRPMLRWAYLMFYRGALLDGHAGWVYAALQTIYEYLIVLKTRELTRGLAAAARAAEPQAGTGRMLVMPSLSARKPAASRARAAFISRSGDSTLAGSIRTL